MATKSNTTVTSGLKHIMTATALAIVCLGFFPKQGICSEQSESENKTGEAGSSTLSVSPDLLAIPEMKERLTAYDENQKIRVKALAAKYLPALEAKIIASTDAGALEQTLSFQEEKKRIETLLKRMSMEETVPVIAMESLDNLPDKAPETLVQLRRTWTIEQRKIRLGLARSLRKDMKELQLKLTQAKDFDSAKTVMEFGQGFSDYVKQMIATTEEKKAASKDIQKNHSPIGKATKDAPFENSLGMRFVPVPISGGKNGNQRLLFSVWEVRLDDYRTYSKSSESGSLFEVNGFVQEKTHPVVNVSWDDAGAFCKWLTEYDREKGKLGMKEYYRLPKDHEWSCAFGIGDEEDPALLPDKKNSTSYTRHSWGESWPPPKGAGNFYGQETKENPQEGKEPIKDYNDGFDRTAPVGSFEANQFGIYDMAGNVDEWCEEWYSNARQKRVVRGSSWYTISENFLRLNYRNRQSPDRRSPNRGFRCVLVADK